jgi:hypothetical protein
VIHRDDPFSAVAALSGVGVAAAHARDAVDALLRQPAVRQDAARVAAEAAVRGARASAALDGAAAEDLGDPVVQGALRATAEVPALAAVWSAAPGQALARIHLLAAKDLTRSPDALGRPRDGIDRVRFDQLLRLVVAPTAAPAVVVAALVHGELATIRPFGFADGVTARVAERVVLVARGVDIKSVSVPEAGHAELARAYGQLLEAYATGAPDGVGAWVRHCCEAYARGAEEGIAICRSLA